MENWKSKIPSMDSICSLFANKVDTTKQSSMVSPDEIHVAKKPKPKPMSIDKMRELLSDGLDRESAQNIYNSIRDGAFGTTPEKVEEFFPFCKLVMDSVPGDMLQDTLKLLERTKSTDEPQASEQPRAKEAFSVARDFARDFVKKANLTGDVRSAFEESLAILTDCSTTGPVTPKAYIFDGYCKAISRVDAALEKMSKRYYDIQLGKNACVHFLNLFTYLSQAGIGAKLHEDVWFLKTFINKINKQNRSNVAYTLAILASSDVIKKELNLDKPLNRSLEKLIEHLIIFLRDNPSEGYSLSALEEEVEEAIEEAIEEKIAEVEVIYNSSAYTRKSDDNNDPFFSFADRP